MLRRRFTIDLPRYAELIDKHGKTNGPEGLLEGHLHCAVFRQRVVDAFCTFRIIHAKHYRETLRLLILLGKNIRAHQNKVVGRQRGVGDLLTPSRRHLFRHWRIAVREHGYAFATKNAFIKPECCFALTIKREMGIQFHDSGTPSPGPFISRVCSIPSVTRNIPGNRDSHALFACGRYWRAFASTEVMVGTRACRLAVWISAAPGQLMSPPQRNIRSFPPTAVIRIMWVSPLGDFTAAPVQPNLRASSRDSTSIKDSSITTGQSLAASCMTFSGCALRSRAVGCSVYLILW